MRSALAFVPLSLMSCLFCSCGSDFEDTPVQDGGVHEGGGSEAGVEGGADVASPDGAGGTGGTGHDAGEDVGVAGSAGTDGGAGAGGQDGGTDGAIEDVVSEPVCDPLSEPESDACVIHEDHGVFVSPAGTDSTTCGTRTAPCATIGHGMMRASFLSKRVYACADPDVSYEETLVVNAALGAVDVHGGLDCDDWTYSATRRARVAPASGVALTIDGGSDVRFTDIDFVAAAVSVPGASSLAVRVHQSQAVVLRRCGLSAGAGAAGEGGQPGTAGSPGATAGTAQDGKVCKFEGGQPQVGGAWPTASACGSRGGAGGGGLVADDGGPGQKGMPTTGLVNGAGGGGGLGGTQSSPAGKPGDDGAGGLDGNNGAAGLAGTFSAQGYTPASGKPGATGSTGQGGGGGGGAWSTAGMTAPSGGAGGMGGCGGTFGTGGEGGGASIALLIWDSEVTLDACTVQSGDGGAGGDGAGGGQGGAGSAGGVGNSLCQELSGSGAGGKGGDGGRGGSGSGGTGGPSYAIVFHGGVPQVSGSTLGFGSGGDGGTGGQATGGTKAPNGPLGGLGNMFEAL